MDGFMRLPEGPGKNPANSANSYAASNSGR